MKDGFGHMGCVCAAIWMEMLNSLEGMGIVRRGQQLTYNLQWLYMLAYLMSLADLPSRKE